jgi:hypothetical protein
MTPPRCPKCGWLLTWNKYRRDWWCDGEVDGICVRKPYVPPPHIVEAQERERKEQAEFMSLAARHRDLDAELKDGVIDRI